MLPIPAKAAATAAAGTNKSLLQMGGRNQE